MKTLELRLEAPTQYYRSMLGPIASDKGNAKAMAKAKAISLRNANEHYIRNTVEH